MTSSRPRRSSTSTTAFGVGRREGHDASTFYRRFPTPELSDADDVAPVYEPDTPIVLGDSRDMSTVADASVALVVTSPPYFAGKAYEQDLTAEGVPGTYVEYLEMLRDVFAECKRKLEPGGRIAVNVANLGRKPYRSLSADVIRILQDDLRLLLRGEIIWVKADGAGGNCAWGSFRQATNPVLRDLSERVIIASKGRFDRAKGIEERREANLPWKSWISNDEFMDASVDVWRMPPESASRVGHPAPFPVELPQRLIDLYTFQGDLVLDPFLGSGTTAVAAARRGRRYVGYDTEPSYVDIARGRLAAERNRQEGEPSAGGTQLGDLLIPGPISNDDFQSRATEEGKAALALAKDVLDKMGFRITREKYRVPGLGVTVNVVAVDHAGDEWYFDVTGAFTSTKGGLRRTDTLWKCLGRANVLQQHMRAQQNVRPLVLLTSHLPSRRSTGDRALRVLGPSGIHDAIEMLSADGAARLALYAEGGRRTKPQPGFWTESDLRS